MPAILLVEDVESNRNIKVDILREMAGRGPVIAVEDSDAAIRAVRALPCFDLIVTDINLPRDKSNLENRDGVSFARWLRESEYPALLTGYSAVFSEGEIPGRDRKLFADFLGRTEGADRILEKFGEWIAKSQNFRKAAWEALQANRRGAESKAVDFSAGVLSLDVIDPTDEQTIKELLREGFEMRLAYPSTDKSYGRAFFVWSRDSDDEATVEVFGQPHLYSGGTTVEEAEESLRVLMRSYFDDLKDMPSERMSRPLTQLRKFLCEVFNG
jgi:CheY-like chemotaxis protein